MTDTQQNKWQDSEDEIIRTSWGNPFMGYGDITAQLPGRTEGAMRHRAAQMRLGTKARPPKPGQPKTLTPWDEDMPSFEDHPDAGPPGSLANALKAGVKYRQAINRPGAPVGHSMIGDGSRRVLPRGVGQ